MTGLQSSRQNRLVKLVSLTLVLGGCTMATILATPAMAQENTVQEIRLRKLEAEVRALQRQVFPGGDGKFFPADGTAQSPATPQAGVPATTAVTDLLTRVDALEAQNARLTSQNEEIGNRLRQLEGRGAVATSSTATTTPAATSPVAAPVPKPAPAPTPLIDDKTATATNTAAMTGKGATDKPVPAKPALPTKPSPQRIAAVKAIIKPQTKDAGEDEYSYGLKLWQAKFYPEAEQQLKLFLDKFPKHPRVEYARNLMGRAFLDEGNPLEAAKWFYQNYKANKNGERAPDSLLYLSISMVQLKDTTKACIALGEFTDRFAKEAAGRLKAPYVETRDSVKCS